jgi:hypothetical protein
MWMSDDLRDALKDFLESYFGKRRMCPQCLQFLPAHYDDCKVGRLARAYAGERLPPLVIEPPPDSLTKTGKARKPRKKKVLEAV